MNDWPRSIYVCGVPDCRYVQSADGQVGSAYCPAHGTALTYVVVEPVGVQLPGS